jgi:hypothetical protein
VPWTSAGVPWWCHSRQTPSLVSRVLLTLCLALPSRMIWVCLRTLHILFNALSPVIQPSRSFCSYLCSQSHVNTVPYRYPNINVTIIISSISLPVSSSLQFCFAKKNRTRICHATRWPTTTKFLVPWTSVGVPWWCHSRQTPSLVSWVLLTLCRALRMIWVCLRTPHVLFNALSPVIQPSTSRQKNCPALLTLLLQVSWTSSACAVSFDFPTTPSRTPKHTGNGIDVHFLGLSTYFFVLTFTESIKGAMPYLNGSESKNIRFWFDY